MGIGASADFKEPSEGSKIKKTADKLPFRRPSKKRPDKSVHQKAVCSNGHAKILWGQKRRVAWTKRRSPEGKHGRGTAKKPFGSGFNQKYRYYSGI